MEEQQKYASDAGEPSAVSIEELNTLFDSMLNDKFTLPELLTVSKGRCTMRLPCKDVHLRPGGFISGPTQMGVADHAAFVALFTHAGITPMALTSNLNINFLRPAQGAWLDADARIMKFGRSGVVVDVTLYAEKSDKPCSHSLVTYVMPKTD